MTTAATVVGHFPLVLATGPGAGARNSIGIMLVSGMIIGTLFTLFVVPSIYMLVARNRVPGPGARRREDGQRSCSWRRLQYETLDISLESHVADMRFVARSVGRDRLGAGPVDDAVRSVRLQPDRTVELTLEDAVRRAVENNPDLAIVRLGTEVEAARVGESRSAFAPVFSTVLGRSSSVVPPSNSLLGDRGVDVNDWFSSTGVRQRLPWGAGTWSVSWDTSRTTTNNPLSSFDPSLQSGFQVAFSQPLLKDRRIDAARQQYIIARRNQESSELRFRESVVQTVAAVKQAYWTLKATMANVTVQQRSLELAQELARQNRIACRCRADPAARSASRRKPKSRSGGRT